VHTALKQSAGRTQWEPDAQPAHDPPQSTSVSVPFLTVSLHVGAWHCPALQTSLAQSAFTIQAADVGHDGHDPPPQSTSVSLPFATPSVHVGAWQTAFAHIRLSQSAFFPHVLPAAQPAQEPPQSTSVSDPFRTPSPQPGFWQVFVTEQKLETQSESAPHFLPMTQLDEHDPPQSTSVSVPFRTPSAHVGAAHDDDLHESLVQSPPPPHFSPFGHPRQMPPQSTSVSDPFFTVSAHDALWQVPDLQTPL
jgi:hypothetical protein